MNDNQNLNQGVNNNPVSDQNTSQNDYYNNDAYYSNDNYNSSNYSDTSYEEPEKKNGVWWKILLGILVILIIIILLLKFCTGGKTKEEKYTELQTTICNAANTYVEQNPTVIDKTNAGSAVVIKLQKLSDANLIESQISNPYYSGSLFKKSDETKYYSMNNSVRLTVLTNGTLNCELVDNSSDVTAPELKLLGDAEITLAIGTEFEDLGYTATDDYDGDITSNVVRSGNVDNTKAGEYIITYTVSDSAGNTTSKTRKVIYEEYADLDITLGTILDTVTPMISLKGSNPYCMVLGTQYVEPGAIATDNVDGDITNRIAVTSKVSGNLMGAFRVTYKVEDSSGNQAIAYRAVIVTTSCPEQSEELVVANNAPVITLVGKSSVTINKGTEYIDLGATAYDKEDGDLTSKITTDTTAVNVNVTGVYKVHYRVIDSQGKLATAIRTVTVKEDVSGTPSVRFTGSKSNITVAVGEGKDSLISAPKAVNESGVAVSVSTKIEDYGTKEAVSTINWNKVGKYRVTYTAVHGNGSIKQTKSIVVTIVDNGATIGGKTDINVAKRDANCDITEADLLQAGVTFSSGAIVSVSGPDRMVCTLGTYTVTVSAKTATTSANTKQITVHVIDGTSTLDVTAPSKVIVTGNSANTSDPYNSNGKWVGGAVTAIQLTFSATPAANTEIARYELSTDCNTATLDGTKTTATTGTASWTLEGKNSVCIRAVTTAGSKGPWSDKVLLYLDKTGPKVEFTHTWLDEKEDWHSAASLTLTYKASDSASGLDHFEYTYDDVKAKKAEEITTYNEASGSLVVSEGTEPTRSSLFVYVRAVDKTGNKGEWTTNPAFANMDTVKPYAPTLTVSDNETSVVKLTANFTDQPSTRPSGFGKLIYKVDSGSEQTETSKIINIKDSTIKENTKKTVEVWAVDKAGNRSDLSATENIIVAPMKVVATGVTLKNGSTEISDGSSCSTTTIYSGSSITLTAIPIPADSEETDVTWATSNGNVATVNEKGVVSVKTVGTATITAKIGSVQKTCTITSKAAISSGGSSSSGGGITSNIFSNYCIKCSSNNVCSTCNSGYKLSNGQCVAEQVTCTCIDTANENILGTATGATAAACVVACQNKFPSRIVGTDKKVCVGGYTTSSLCKSAANSCANGYSGCVSTNSEGCYFYTCKSSSSTR